MTKQPPDKTASATVTYRKRRLAFALTGLGMVIILFHGVIQDYAYGAFMTDGIFIPYHSYKSPGGTAGEVAHTFRIYNLRARRLQVQAEPDCGCTGTSWKSAAIAPFGWKDLIARMRVRKGSSQSVSITIRTDSRDKPFLFAFLRTQ
jgi:hypothetical protein